MFGYWFVLKWFWLLLLFFVTRTNGAERGQWSNLPQCGGAGSLSPNVDFVWNQNPHALCMLVWIWLVNADWIRCVFTRMCVWKSYTVLIAGCMCLDMQGQVFITVVFIKVVESIILNIWPCGIDTLCLIAGVQKSCLVLHWAGLPRSARHGGRTILL